MVDYGENSAYHFDNSESDWLNFEGFDTFMGGRTNTFQLIMKVIPAAMSATMHQPYHNFASLIDWSKTNRLPALE